MTPASAPAARGDGLTVQVAWCRHRGNFRHENEDSVLVAPLGASTPAAADDGTSQLKTAGAGFVAAVCDGVGGGAAGEVASSLAVHELLTALSDVGSFAAAAEARSDVLRRAAERAHVAIVHASERDPSTEGMGTTMTAAWLVNLTLFAVQVGDSRLYRLRHGAIEQLSADQSLVGRMRRAGELTDEQARQHPLRNLIDQVLGGSKVGVEPAVFSVPIVSGDSFLVCSDGLTDALPDRVIARELAAGAHRPPAVVVRRLLDLVLETSGRDNISIILLRTGGVSTLVRAWFTALTARIRPKH